MVTLHLSRSKQADCEVEVLLKRHSLLNSDVQRPLGRDELLVKDTYQLPQEIPGILYEWLSSKGKKAMVTHHLFGSKQTDCEAQVLLKRHILLNSDVLRPMERDEFLENLICEINQFNVLILLRKKNRTYFYIFGH